MLPGYSNQWNAFGRLYRLDSTFCPVSNNTGLAQGSPAVLPAGTCRHRFKFEQHLAARRQRRLYQ